MPTAAPATWLFPVAIVAASAAFAGTWLVRRYALHRGIVDAPGERRSHSLPTPRGGGAAVVCGWLPALAAWAALAPGTWPLAALVAAGTLLVAAVGWIDDHRPLSPWPRLAVHAVAALVLAGVAWLAGGGPVLALVAFLLALGLVNAWNFMDGIDGIAALHAAIVAAALALATGGAGLVAGAGLAAACLGFLPWNFPRARIFLGDVGSGALGYAIAALAVLAALAQPSPATWPLLLLPLVPFGVDTTLTLCRRIVAGERWWTPHVTHAYQVQARRHGHRRVTLAYAGAAVALSSVMLAVLGVWPDRIAFNIVIPVVAVSLAARAWQMATRSTDPRDPPPR